MRAIVQSHLPPSPPSKGIHYCGRGFVLLKLTSHKVHSGGHVLEKAVVPFTQVVKAGLSIRGTYEAVLGTFPIAGKQESTLPALGRYEFPIVFRQSKTFGSKIHEINPSDGVCYPIVSDRVISILENNGITGWKTYPIILYDKHGNRLDGYNGFYVDVMDGKDLSFELPKYKYDKSTEKLKCIVVKRGWLDITNWDGRDFTRAERATIVTERVVNLFKKEKVTGISFIKYSKEYDIICSK